MTNVSDITAEVVTKLRRDMHQPTKDELRAQLALSATKQIELVQDLYAQAGKFIFAHRRASRNAALAWAGWTAFAVLAAWALLS